MRPTPAPHLLAVALATAALGATAAHAGGSGVVVTGDAALQAPLAAGLESWLRDHGRALVASPLDPDAINLLHDCFVIEDEACARDVFDRRARTEHLVYATVTVTPNTTDGTRDATLVAYWFTKGKPPVADRRVCERCTSASLRAAADDLLAALAAATQGAGRLRLASTPAPARVSLDGGPVGVTPLELEVVPGAHTLVFAADGRAPETRMVTLRDGESRDLSVALAPGDDGGARIPPLVPKLLVGAGAVGLLAGAVLVVTSEHPDKDGGPTYRDTEAGGYALAAGGALAAGVGAYLWLRGGKASAAPTVALTRGGGGVVGWARAF